MTGYSESRVRRAVAEDLERKKRMEAKANTADGSANAQNEVADLEDEDANRDEVNNSSSPTNFAENPMMKGVNPLDIENSFAKANTTANSGSVDMSAAHSSKSVFSTFSFQENMRLMDSDPCVFANSNFNDRGPKT